MRAFRSVGHFWKRQYAAAATPTSGEPPKIFEVEDEEALREELMSPNMKGTLIVDCYANWCGPCKKLTPLLVDAVSKTPNARLAKLNVDEHDRLPEMLKVSAIPAVFAFYKGNMIATFVGVPSTADLATWVTNVADPEEFLKEADSAPASKQ